MITLNQIDEMFPETHDGSLYSDLYKDVYGCRPRGCSFESMEEFEKDYEYLIGELNRQQAEDEIRKTENFKKLSLRSKISRAMLAAARTNAQSKLSLKAIMKLTNLSGMAMSVWNGYMV